MTKTTDSYYLLSPVVDANGTVALMNSSFFFGAHAEEVHVAGNRPQLVLYALLFGQNSYTNERFITFCNLLKRCQQGIKFAQTAENYTNFVFGQRKPIHAFFKVHRAFLVEARIMRTAYDVATGVSGDLSMLEAVTLLPAIFVIIGFHAGLSKRYPCNNIKRHKRSLLFEKKKADCAGLKTMVEFILNAYLGNSAHVGRTRPPAIGLILPAYIPTLRTVLESDDFAKFASILYCSASTALHLAYLLEQHYENLDSTLHIEENSLEEHHNVWNGMLKDQRFTLSKPHVFEYERANVHLEQINSLYKFIQYEGQALQLLYTPDDSTFNDSGLDDALTIIQSMLPTEFDAHDGNDIDTTKQNIFDLVGHCKSPSAGSSEAQCLLFLSAEQTCFVCYIVDYNLFFWCKNLGTRQLSLYDFYTCGPHDNMNFNSLFTVGTFLQSQTELNSELTALVSHTSTNALLSMMYKQLLLSKIIDSTLTAAHWMLPWFVQRGAIFKPELNQHLNSNNLDHITDATVDDLQFYASRR